MEKKALEAWLRGASRLDKNGAVEGLSVSVRSRNKCSRSKSIFSTRRIKVCGERLTLMFTGRRFLDDDGIEVMTVGPDVGWEVQVKLPEIVL